LCAGFPCQPFSQAGFKKGFADIRGTLFFDIAEIIRIKQPKAFFLENVRGLYSHDEGRTFETIKKTLTQKLGYSFHHAIVKASDHGLPQHRPRLFMVGFKDLDTEFEFPKTRKLKFTMSDVMKGEVDREIGYTLRVGGKRSPIDDRRNWDGYIVDGEVRRVTGIKHLLDLKALLKVGFSAILSTLAFIAFACRLASFAQVGINPHRAVLILRSIPFSSSLLINGITVVGEIFQLLDV